MKGYVTTLNSISGKSELEMERALGFRAGALKAGYAVYALAAPVSIDEFDWRDRTRYSGGWDVDSSIRFGSNPNTLWSVQRRDELRAALGKKRNYNERATDLAIEQILRGEVAKLKCVTAQRGS
jgi:hypothetical protein